jgi:hypothetical protein
MCTRFTFTQKFKLKFKASRVRLILCTHKAVWGALFLLAHTGLPVACQCVGAVDQTCLLTLRCRRDLSNSQSLTSTPPLSSSSTATSLCTLWHQVRHFSIPDATYCNHRTLSLNSTSTRRPPAFFAALTPKAKLSTSQIPGALPPTGARHWTAVAADSHSHSSCTWWAAWRIRNWLSAPPQNSYQRVFH